jgi:hypothetical protein
MRLSFPKWFYAENLFSNISEVVPKALRFELFLARLASAPTASSHDDALALIANTLTEVEDLLSGATANPSEWLTDGRMYPPQLDNARPSEDFEGVTIYRNKGHRTLIASDGAIQIVEIHSSKILIEKQGGGIPFYQTTPDSRKT